ncbi:hypothetical protein DRW41_18610 [Neobacillus piezotolerans]|uniref:Uncharacterized protein n=1 Tax=Neobacillus piezotolerans TaxID=2259171 RepID=A0A3D8GLY4_9BACI|nr:hypothetical protein [Neobacillus piezotolerans]RDU35297.1 hypothetical protein DRW41_18610 [Neobacillus piezotolerans]
MKAAALLFFMAGAMFAVAALYHIGLYKRPGMYPPKQILKARAVALAAGAIIFLLFGVLIVFLG